MSVLKVGEFGKIVQMGTSFDMSANTDLNIVFTKPDQTQLTVTAGVTAPAIPATVDVNGVSTTFAANEYLQYSFVSGDLDQAGTWIANGVYIEGTTKRFCGDAFSFLVLTC